MNASNPLEPILDQIADILQKTEEELENPSDKKVPADLLKKVEELEKLVQLYVRVHRILMKKTHVDEKRLKQIIDHVPETTLAKDRQVLERFAKLKSAVEQAKQLFEKEAKKLKKGLVSEQDKKKRDVTRRKGKFRGVGDQDRWKKL